VASLLTGLAAVLYTRLFALVPKGDAYVVHWQSGGMEFIFAPPFVVLLAGGWSQLHPFSRGAGIPQVNGSIELAPHESYNDRVKRY